METSESTIQLAEDESRTMDEIMNERGMRGFLQFFVHLSMCYIAFINYGQITLTFFSGYNPPWKCTENSTSVFCSKNFNKTIAHESSLYGKRCELNRTDWTYSSAQEYSFVTEFDLVCGKTSIAAIIGASFHVGCLIGALFSGTISDKYGRKCVLMISSIFLPFPTFVASYVNAVWQICVLDLLRGIASVSALFTGYVHLTEFTPPKHRPLSCNFFMIGATLSYLSVDLLTYLTQEWRVLCRYMALVTLPVLPAFLLLPESPRWLLMKGRKDEAELIVGKILVYKSNQTRPSIAYESSAAKTGKVEEKYSYLDLVRMRDARKLTLCMIVMWAVVPIVYYAVAKQSMTSGGNMYVDYAMTILADVPGTFAAAFLSNAIGRKFVNVGGLLTSSALVACMTLIPISVSYRHIIIMVITVLARLTCDIAFVGIYLWTSELYPTVVRSQGVSVCAISEKIGMISVPFITTLAAAVSNDMPLIFISVCGILAGLAGLLLPETKNQATREKIEDMAVTNKDKKSSKKMEKKMEKEMKVKGADNMSHSLDEPV